MTTRAGNVLSYVDRFGARKWPSTVTCATWATEGQFGVRGVSGPYMLKTMEGVYGNDGIQYFRATNGNDVETMPETIGTTSKVLR